MPGPSARPLEGVTILVVDDDADAREVLRQMVEWFGARVYTARDGREALDLLETEVPDLLLLDLRMPRLDGFGVFAHVRADPRLGKLRAIAVTALGRDDDVMRTLEAGFDGHLVKPIDFDVLAAALRRALWAHSGQDRFRAWHASTVRGHEPTAQIRSRRHDRGHSQPGSSPARSRRRRAR